MAISSNDYLVLQQTASGQIRKTTVGNLLAQVTPGAENLSELNDVDLTLLTDGQILVYDDATSSWKPEDISDGVDLSNYLEKPGSEGVFVINEDSAGTITYEPLENYLGSKVIVSDTAPATDDLDEGTLWWNSDADDLNLYVLYNDPAPDAGLKWVQAFPGGGGGDGGSAENAVLLNDGGTKQVIKSAGLGISDGTNENIKLLPNGSIQAGSSTATGFFAGNFRINAAAGSGFGALYAQNFTAGGRVFVGANATNVQTSKIYEDGTADFVSVNYQYGQIDRLTTNDTFNLLAVGNTNGIKIACKGDGIKIGTNLTDLNNASNSENLHLADTGKITAKEQLVSNRTSTNQTNFRGQLNGTTTFEVRADGSIFSLGGQTVLGNYKVVVRGDGHLRLGPSANVDSQTNIVMRWDTGNISTVGTVSASNITTRNSTDTGDIDVGERISHLLTRLDAIESNEIIDDATDTSLLQLLASASSRLDSIEARLAALEGGN